MKLYVMRHGTAEDDAADGRDESRALTMPGRERVREIADRLIALGEAPKAIVSSPLVRALQTAELVASTQGFADVVTAHSALAPGGLAIGFVHEEFEAGRRRLMVVGHEPDLSTLVGHLLGQPLPSPLAKAMVVGLRITDPGAPAELRFVLDPKSLSLLVDRRT